MMLFGCLESYAQWSSDPTVNNAICVINNDQRNVSVTSDGNGGAIMTWEDIRNTSPGIYAQRINSNGVLQWTSNGVIICTGGQTMGLPIAISDGSGGAIICWQDTRGGSYTDIYAQKINSSGTVQWTANGVVICNSSYNQSSQSICSDGSGGAIISWHDLRNGSTHDIYSQRINSSGTVQWSSNGVAVCSASQTQERPAIVSNGSGGAIISWTDFRNGCDIYAQLINSSGAVQWTSDGIVISNASGPQDNSKLISDGSSGAILCWEDARGSNYDIYTQKVNSSGTVQWTTNGVPICTATDAQRKPKINIDGSGGAIITWYDLRGGSTNDIYAQRINSSGTVQWSSNGTVICSASNDQIDPAIESDVSGGALITWYDLRGGSTYDIYAQSVNTSGTVQWASDGVAISTASNIQRYPSLVADGSGGAIIAWEDRRAGGSSHDIYASHITSGGTLPVNLLYFKTECAESIIKLDWATASELNNDFFTVEKSKDGSHFESIAMVDGAGNSNQILKYSLLVNEDDHEEYYYRLKQTDFDGHFEYSNPEFIKCNETINFDMFPNPSNGAINFHSNNKCTLEIVDYLGKIIYTVNLSVSNNNSSFINTLKQGIYHVRMEDYFGNCSSKKLVILNQP